MDFFTYYYHSHNSLNSLPPRYNSMLIIFITLSLTECCTIMLNVKITPILVTYFSEFYITLQYLVANIFITYNNQTRLLKRELLLDKPI